MTNAFLIIYSIVAIIVVVLILFQGRGAGLGSAWGGSGETFSTRRGVEKFTFKITIAMVILFFLLSIAYLFI
jgi:preprotein translocase subunit SecG